MPYFALIIMFYHVKIACYQWPTRTPRWCLRGTRSDMLACDGPTGIVGPGIGVVTHLR